VLKVLFVCSKNRLRSPTAEAIFSGRGDIEVSSAGTSNDAGNPISADLVEWADIVFAMERVHRKRISDWFGSLLRGKKIVVLGIPDNYEYMDPELIAILEKTVPPHLRTSRVHRNKSAPLNSPHSRPILGRFARPARQPSSKPANGPPSQQPFRRRPLKSTMMSCPLLVPGILDHAASLFPSVEIVSVKPDGTRARSTMRDLHRRARRLSAALQHAGIAPGDRVATLMWNQHEHLEAYFGIPSAGAVLHTLNFRLHPDDVAYIVGHAEDRFLIVDHSLLDVFESIRSKVQFERIFVVDHPAAPLPAGTESYEAFLASTTAEPTHPTLAEDDAAAM
jgi:predicted protein tyrosine phosphatase